MQHYSEKELEQILSGCRKRVRSSQHALYKLFYPYGMSICIRYADSEGEAIAVLNEGIFKVFQNIGKYDPMQPFKPWFRTIVVNTAINHVKKQRKFKLEVSMEEAMHIPEREDILSRIGYKELMSMVQSLSAAYRTVFNMYVIDGFKHEEIAGQLGISVSTSKSNLTRARARLKQMILQKIDTRYV
jgi:RNA polymerase sigma-70 factor (ECF subfamily)